jgi:hypothetical protein
MHEVKVIMMKELALFLSIVFFFDLFSIGLSQSHDLSCGFGRLTRVVSPLIT